jgi:catechol 2,3-dioxygenase-like lactoylglutathione lyase family enzyme
MVMKRSKDPWMPADDFGRSLPRGIGVNLLVRDMAAEIAFCRDCLGAMILDSNEDFAAIELCGSVFMLHADHSYANHPMSGIVAGAETRGAGVEIRVYGLDPDKAEARARGRGDHVLAGSLDKPHGLRECFIVDPEGYVWVPGTQIRG